MTTTEHTSTAFINKSSSAQPTGIESLLSSGDHKPVGRLWIQAGSFFLIAALGLTLLAAFEAIDFSSLQLLQETDEYVQVGSLAQELLIFGAVVPIVIGLGTYLVPLQLGSSSLAFPRGAAAAFWTWLLGCALLIASYLANGGPGGGRSDFVELWILSLGMIVIAIIWALTCIATTVLGLRTVGLTMARVPATSWSFLVFSVVGILVLPVTLAELVVSYVRLSGNHLALADSAVLTGIIQGVQTAPALYWLGIPVLGVLIDVVSGCNRAPVRPHKVVLAVIGLAGITSFGSQIVGFATLRDAEYNWVYIVAMLVAVLPVLAVLALLGPKLKPAAGARRSVSPFAALLSGLLLLLAVIAGLIGIVAPVVVSLADLGVNGVDPTATIVVNETTFDEGIKAAIVGSALLALIAGLNFWSAKIWGRYLNQPFLSAATLAVFVGTVLWAFGRVGAGFDDQQAFPATELTGGSQVEWLSTISAAGVAAVTVGAVLLFFSVGQARKVGKLVEPRWTGLTLEWLTDSPPLLGNFDAPPVVSSPTPVLDARPEEESPSDGFADAATSGGIDGSGTVLAKASKGTDV